MGLDVYLYHCPDRKSAAEIERQYSTRSDVIWEKHSKGREFNKIPESDREAARVECLALSKELGVEDDGTHPSAKSVRNDSSKYPEHLFKVGYFRSSYNSGGINSYLSRLGLPDLGWIFDVKDEYEIVPDWEQAKRRAAEVLAKLNSVDTSFDVFELHPNPFVDPATFPSSAEAARAAYLKECAGEHSFPAYENTVGYFNREGMKVLGLINGTRDFLGRTIPCVFVVHEKVKDPYYTEALEIVIETCDFVLAQPDPQDYYLHWSG